MTIIVQTIKYQWIGFELFKKSVEWCKCMRRRMETAGDRSPWWIFIWHWEINIITWLRDFMSGNHRFSPMIYYEFPDKVIRAWTYLDRLILHLILNIIKSTFKYVISPLCLHLKGPSVIKDITQDIKVALNTKKYNYFLRIDIRSYYAAIDHKILLKKLYENYDDSVLRRYFEAIVTTGIDVDGQVILPKRGIPIRSSLSPFFGALYLTELDRAFENRKGCFYKRYMDDIIILVENKQQYTKARIRLFKILKGLRLKISQHKTKMGQLKKGFHFLGCNFEVSRNPQKKIQEAAVDIHNRSCRRALDRVKAMRKDAVHPANIQRYLLRWASWWCLVTKLNRYELIMRWVIFAELMKYNSVWLGRGLLMDSLPYYYPLLLT